mgnify:CR=1 FL=1
MERMTRWFAPWLLMAVTLLSVQTAQARDLPDAFVHEVAQEVWIHFPWDTEERAGGLAYTPPLAHLEKT